MSRRPWISQLLLAGSLVVAAAMGACSKNSWTRFPHQMHLAGIECGREGKPACLDCNNCHTVSKEDRAQKLPQSEVCSNCHHDQTTQIQTVLASTPERPSGPIHFDHDQHLAMREIEGQCVRCHSGVVKKGGTNMPSMLQCFTCHEHEQQWQVGQCLPCHDREHLAKSMPQTFLRHDQGFLQHHGTLAQQEKKMCESCHTQAQCASCHDITQDLAIEHRQPERIERNFVHRGDFMVRHAIEAQDQPGKCVRCHTVESCDACHVERGVSGNAVNGRNPHPIGWVGTNAASKTFHGREARRDILKCASCHEQGPATNCIRCHKVGGFGGNPHPGGWKSLQSKSSTMCRYCHG